MDNLTALLPDGKPIVQADLRQIVEIHEFCLPACVYRVHLVGQGMSNMDSCQRRERMVLA